MSAQSTSDTPRERLEADAVWHLREADSEADAYYLVRQWAHYFGADYGPSAEYPDEYRLPAPLFPIAGWENDDVPETNSRGVIAIHDPPDTEASVRIGGGLVDVLDPADARDELPADVPFDPDALLPERSAFLFFGAVDAAWRGRGIGRAMMRRRLRWGIQDGATLAFGFSWQRDGRPDSTPLFEHFGFEPLARFPDFYASDASGRSSCPDCALVRSPPDDERCACGAVLYALDLPTNPADLPE